MKAKKIARADVRLDQNPSYREDRQQTLCWLILSGRPGGHLEVRDLFREYSWHLLTKTQVANLLEREAERIGPVVDYLAECGLLRCPNGPNSGWVMTSICRQIVDELLAEGERIAGLEKDAEKGVDKGA